jgi:glycosyltransferase involved in cell wall biosynthesis
MENAEDLMCFSHLRWGFVFQRPNHLMSRCATERRTFFWEEPVVASELRPGAGRCEVKELECGVVVMTPHLSSALDSEGLAREQRALLDRSLLEHRIDHPVLWFYTPMALEFASHIPASAIVYDCMDELSAFRGAPARLQAREQELFARADVVFTGGHQLFEAKRREHPHVYAFPSSVDRDHFARAREPIAEPEDQRAIPRVRLGYAGVIDERLDLDLLAAVADADPAWHVVMIGPVVKVHPCTLPRRPNLHYLGMKGYESLPSYMAGWDVALMPFALNEATRLISPTKTLEYLAAGKPVVSTPVRDVVRPYAEKGLVRIGQGEAFVREIAAALVDPPEPRRALADALVAQTSWDATWRRMSELMTGLAPTLRAPSVEQGAAQ